MSDEERVDFHAWLDEPRNAKSLSEMRTLVGLIQELPDKKVESLRRMARIMDWWGGGEAKSTSSKVVSPPGHTLASAAKFLLAPNAYKRYVEPVIADMQQEYADAIAAGYKQLARWIAFRVHLFIIPGWLYAFVTGKLAALLRRGH